MNKKIDYVIIPEYMKLINAKKIILNTLFPQFCINCQRQGKIICDDCLSLIDITPFQYCPFCSKPHRVFNNNLLCKKHSREKLDGLFFACNYQDKIAQKIIHSFKYEPYLKTLSTSISDLIISHFLLSEKQAIFQTGENSTFIPLPLFRNKKKERGFNQSELIAHHLSGYFKIPLEKNNLIKIKKTPQQVGLGKEERRKNIANAFALKYPENIKGKTIFLVDDVFTTGATLSEAAKLLKKYRAKKVWGITLARESLEKN